MNGFERISATLGGHPTDKIPIMLHNFMMAAHEAGVTMGQFRKDPEVIARVFISSVEKYQYDGILVDMDTVTLAGAAGVPIDFPIHEPARSHKGSLESMDDVWSMKPVNIENYEQVQVWLEAVRLIKEYFGDEIYIRGNCDQAPFALASIMRGPQNWMIDLLTADQKLIFHLLEYCEHISKQFIRLMAQTGCHMVSNGDSPAGPEMISPDMFEMFALPFEIRMVETAHSLGLPYALHICGNTEAILEQMLLTGADAIELDYKTDITKVYNLYHDKVALIGNIDPSGVLALGTTDHVKKMTYDLLKTYSRSNRFILNAGCAIPSSTPPENLAAMIQMAREFK